MNEPRMPALLTGGGRPGFYFRVLHEATSVWDEIVKSKARRLTVERPMRSPIRQSPARSVGACTEDRRPVAGSSLLRHCYDAGAATSTGNADSCRCRGGSGGSRISVGRLRRRSGNDDVSR
jgi:hypothetical protein